MSVSVKVLEEVLEWMCIADRTLQVTDGLGYCDRLLLAVAVQAIYEIYVVNRQ